VRTFYLFAEISLIGIMSLCGTFALTSSKIYQSLHELFYLYPVAPYVSLIIWVLLLILGILIIILRGKSSGVFTGLVIFISLPSMLSFNSIDLARLFHLESIGAAFSTTLNFFETLIIGLVIIICYLSLNFMNILKKSRSSLIKQGATPSDIDSIYSKSHLVLLEVMGIVLIITVIIAAFAQGIELLLSSVIQWNLVLLGLGCTLLIVVYIYWIVSRRKHIS
jgi:hypothetical protein